MGTDVAAEEKLRSRKGCHLAEEERTAALVLKETAPVVPVRFGEIIGFGASARYHIVRGGILDV